MVIAANCRIWTLKVVSSNLGLFICVEVCTDLLAVYKYELLS